MPSLLLIAVPAVLGILLGWYFGSKANARHSAFGHQQHPRIALLGALAGPAYFTPEGWRYRKLALMTSTGGVALSLLVGLLLWWR
jgi:hypothetical protein